MTEPAPPPSRDRLPGRYYDQCPACRSHRCNGPDCAGGGPADPRTARKRDHAALRRYVTDLLGTQPHDPLIDPSDCQHGCNGACVETGSDRCDFTCHTDDGERPR
jgi:hypothetical protein